MQSEKSSGTFDLRGAAEKFLRQSLRAGVTPGTGRSAGGIGSTCDRLAIVVKKWLTHPRATGWSTATHKCPLRGLSAQVSYRAVVSEADYRRWSLAVDRLTGQRANESLRVSRTRSYGYSNPRL